MDKSRLCEIFFNNPLKLISIYKVSFTKFLKVATRLHVLKTNLLLVLATISVAVT